jgi:hypothetical protein
MQPTKIENCTLLLYTHSDYDDVFEVSMKRIEKHFRDIPVSVCTNNSQLVKDKYFIQSVIRYNDNETYCSKLASSLENIHTPYVILYHDNNIFVGDVDTQKINTILEEMIATGADTVRLSFAGIHSPNAEDLPLLKRNTGPYYLSVFPAIWKTQSLLAFCREFIGSIYRTVEVGESQVYCSSLKNYYIRSSTDAHSYMSQPFPSIHLVMHGKWLLSEHRKEVQDLALEYSIDLGKRGFV